MTVRLSDDLRSAIEQRGDDHVTIVDDVTQTRYVLVPMEEFDVLRRTAALYDSGDLSADEMIAAAGLTFSGSDGWEAPGMEAYDEDVRQSSEP
jgi:hypothetical protein